LIYYGQKGVSAGWHAKYAFHTVQALDRQLSSLEAGTSAAAFSLENVLAEVEDLLSYCNDILCTGERFQNIMPAAETEMIGAAVKISCRGWDD
jgi:hypothetical protein